RRQWWRRPVAAPAGGDGGASGCIAALRRYGGCRLAGVGRTDAATQQLAQISVMRNSGLLTRNTGCEPNDGTCEVAVSGDAPDEPAAASPLSRQRQRGSPA